MGIEAFSETSQVTMAMWNAVAVCSTDGKWWPEKQSPIVKSRLWRWQWWRLLSI